MLRRDGQKKREKRRARQPFLLSKKKKNPLGTLDDEFFKKYDSDIAEPAADGTEPVLKERTMTYDVRSYC